MEHTTAETVRRLRREGWSEQYGEGDHLKFKKQGHPLVVVPTSKKVLKEGTYRDIARKAGWE
ncbi:MAG: type II toxin-antitoxin system HicA family toxin [Coriobacteriales bacterium]|jgi:predicted RNA binding protein YcfA (HicA-like mRNA interferase family)|nr:type II toxin-antitoxin system HicA family toxin [Coriobacteriales bacterium]